MKLTPRGKEWQASWYAGMVIDEYGRSAQTKVTTILGTEEDEFVEAKIKDGV